MRKLVAALLVVGILLVITDRVAVVIAQRDISSRVARRLGFAVPLGALPLYLKVTSVNVGAGGLRITASGRDVHFANRP